MGLLTSTEDKHLEAARKNIEPAETVCPGCKAPLTLSGETLVTFNAALGLEGHACPSCGETISRRKPGGSGFGRL